MIVESESQGEVLFVEEGLYGVEVAGPLAGDVLKSYLHVIVESEGQREVLFVEEGFYGVEVAGPLVGDVSRIGYRSTDSCSRVRRLLEGVSS